LSPFRPARSSAGAFAAPQKTRRIELSSVPDHRLDILQLSPYFALCHLNIKSILQVQPQRSRRPECLRQAQRGIRGDAGLFIWRAAQYAYVVRRTPSLTRPPTCREGSGIPPEAPHRDASARVFSERLFWMCVSFSLAKVHSVLPGVTNIAG
jgi:hypothetical protein